MNLATEPIDQLSQEQEEIYFPLAEAALQQYSLGTGTLTFIQHNAGIVFRVTAETTGHQYLLKLHKRVGAGDDPSAAQLEPGLHWLAALSQASDVVVQVPIPTIQGQFVGQIKVASDISSINCTLQEWLDGSLLNRDFTLDEAQKLGKLMAKLHNFSRTYPLMDASAAMRHDRHALENDIDLLRTTLDTTILSHHDFDIIVTAKQRITEYMTQLGSNSDVWGPVHGDLHYENLLIYNDEIRPIDFTGLRLAHYLFDIAVTLYHSFYQGVPLREAYLSGYQQIGSLPSAYQQYVEAFIAYAAIDNLAWNSTIPEQVKSALFQLNLQNLVKAYCTPVAQGKPFLFS
jgi:Ser/Thr protein kinase RdoA (MazF antagonist)